MLKYYVVDTNLLFSKLDKLGKNRYDIIILDDIISEIAPFPERYQKLQNAGVQMIGPTKKHYEKLKEVLKVHGDNTKLIRLFSNEGVGDVMLIAYILAEKESHSSLFQTEFILVSNDAEAISVAQKYGIECLKELPINSPNM